MSSQQLVTTPLPKGSGFSVLGQFKALEDGKSYRVYHLKDPMYVVSIEEIAAE